jgi:hypothetical protein
MERLTKKIYGTERINWEGVTSVDDIRRDLDMIEGYGFTHIDIEAESDEDSGETEMYFNYLKEAPETDEELNIRIAHNKRIAESRIVREKQLLEELKLKYESQ